MNLIELFYLLGFVLSALIVGALLGKPLGAAGWVIGCVGGLILWAGILWCVKRLCDKLVARRRTTTKPPGSENKGK